MSILTARPLETRYVVTIGIGLLVFSVIAGILTYNYAYRHELKLADLQQQQLIRTLQDQAEAAAFAANYQIAHGVLKGLAANPVIQAARIESTEGFKDEMGSRQSADFSAGTSYPLFSPVDRIKRIGTLVVVQNDAQVNSTAMRSAMFQTLLMLAQVFIGTIIMAIAVRRMLINPITRLAQTMTAIQPGSSMRLEIEKKHAEDEIGQLSKSVNAILAAAETALEEARAQRDELEKLATHDFLTGLPALRLAEDRLHVACSSVRRSNAKVALLFIDLDGFKLVNDNYDHAAGDLVLKEAAKRLRECIRAEDTAARIGGDEFVVILGNLHDAQAAALVAENINFTLSRPFEVLGHSLLLGASIGIAVYPDHTDDVLDMRHVADLAMYRVKKAGKNSYAFGDQEISPDRALS
ncbi:MAG: GGDEF domain-containing protein [Proteobacteria bacterium]|nr:GGDEF domain-containing protein [Pseudomonadota bacterium]